MNANETNALLDNALAALEALVEVFNADSAELTCEENDALNEARIAFDSAGMAPLFGRNRMAEDDIKAAISALRKAGVDVSHLSE